MRKIYRGKDVEEQWESNQKKPEDKNKCSQVVASNSERAC